MDSKTSTHVSTMEFTVEALLSETEEKRAVDSTTTASSAISTLFILLSLYGCTTAINITVANMRMRDTIVLQPEKSEKPHSM